MQKICNFFEKFAPKIHKKCKGPDPNGEEFV
jgi:hypothetical protein